MLVLAAEPCLLRQHISEPSRDHMLTRQGGTATEDASPSHSYSLTQTAVRRSFTLFNCQAASARSVKREHAPRYWRRDAGTSAAGRPCSTNVQQPGSTSPTTSNL